MVRSINEIAQLMGKATIAESVECEATMERLREIGVDYAQGFWLEPPRPLTELSRYSAASSRDTGCCPRQGWLERRGYLLDPKREIRYVRGV